MPIPAVIAALGRFAAGMFSGAARAAPARAAAGGAARATPLVGPPPPSPTGALRAPGSPSARVMPAAVASPGERERGAERLWRYDSAWSLAERGAGIIEGNMPSFEHSITVSVIGGPAADLRRVWYLACAAAFGRYRKRVAGVSDANIEAVWDVTGKAAKISIKYALNGILGNTDTSPETAKIIMGGAMIGLGVGLGIVTGAGLPLIIPGAILAADGAAAEAAKPAVGAGGTRGGIDLMQEGPDQVTVGAPWPEWFRRQPGIAALPDEVKVDTGTYIPFGIVVIDCAEDDLIERFQQRPKIDVLGELPWTGAATGSRYIPYGQVIDVNVIGARAAAYFGTSGVPQPWAERRRKGRFITSAKLPDDGRLITTGEKRDFAVQPPRPWVDGISRMSLVELVTQALSTPCFAVPGVPCGENIPAGGNRDPLYAAGTGITLDYDTLGRPPHRQPTFAIPPVNPLANVIPRLEE